MGMNDINSRIYYPLLYGSIVSYQGAPFKPGLDLTGTVFLRCFNQAINHAAGLCTTERIGKQPVLPAHYKGLNAALGTVVAQLQTVILQTPCQILALFSEEPGDGYTWSEQDMFGPGGDSHCGPEKISQMQPEIKSHSHSSCKPCTLESANSPVERMRNERDKW